MSDPSYKICPPVTRAQKKISINTSARKSKVFSRHPHCRGKMTRTSPLNPLIIRPNFLLKIHQPNISKFHRGKGKSSAAIYCSRLDNSQETSQLNLSVLRFTLGKRLPLSLSLESHVFSLSKIKIIYVCLGIPGLDESYLPRWIGYGFGSLLLLNHFAGGSNLATPTPAQLVSKTLLFISPFHSIKFVFNYGCSFLLMWLDF